MIFITCSTVVPGFGDSITSTAVTSGFGGVDCAPATGATIIPNASSSCDIPICGNSMCIVSVPFFPSRFLFIGTARYHYELDAAKNEKLRQGTKNFHHGMSKTLAGREHFWYYMVPTPPGGCPCHETQYAGNLPAKRRCANASSRRLSPR